MRCLVDTGVWSDGLHLAYRDNGLKLLWWGKELVAVLRKQNWLPVPPPEGHVRRRNDWLSLPGIAHLFSSQAVTPCLSDAVSIELNTTPHSQARDFFGFALNRSERIDTGLWIASNRAIRHEWRDVTKSDASKHLAEVGGERFQHLLPIFGDRHAWDLFHVLSAERHGIEHFVSGDYKFARQFETLRRHHNIPVQIVTPHSLIELHGLSLSSESELMRIRDLFRQQRLHPMCQFRWPRKWTRRYWLAMTGGLEMQPYQNCFIVPDRRELMSALIEMEFGPKNQ